MTVFVVLATGESMSQELADYVRARRDAGACKAIAVCNAYELAPWADALVCNDRKWWDYHKAARKFAGRKFSYQHVSGVQRIPFESRYIGGHNSGLQACRVAKYLGASRILLLGVDMHGTHYFGKHPEQDEKGRKLLRNTSPKKFEAHIKQFDKWRGPPEIVNCTPGSALKRFPFSDIRTELGG